jgi:hypothetical protein
MSFENLHGFRRCEAAANLLLTLGQRFSSALLRFLNPALERGNGYAPQWHVRDYNKKHCSQRGWLGVLRATGSTYSKSLSVNRFYDLCGCIAGQLIPQFSAQKYSACPPLRTVNNC